MLEIKSLKSMAVQPLLCAETTPKMLLNAGYPAHYVDTYTPYHDELRRLSDERERLTRSIGDIWSKLPRMPKPQRKSWVDRLAEGNIRHRDHTHWNYPVDDGWSRAKEFDRRRRNIKQRWFDLEEELADFRVVEREYDSYYMSAQKEMQQIFNQQENIRNELNGLVQQLLHRQVANK